ncbi:MAG: glycosyltransferase family 39 protein [Phycisphaerae bacterium]|jgi:hypothetical protein
MLPGAGVLALALVARLAGITRTDVWADEASTLMLIRASWQDLLVRLHRASDHPPLSFLLFKAWGLASDGEAWMRLLPALMGAAAAGVLMRVARGLHPRAALPTGLLAAVSPVPVHYGQELRCYSLLFLLAALTLWAAQRAAGRPVSISGRNTPNHSRPAPLAGDGDPGDPNAARPSARAAVALLSCLGALAAYTHAVGMFVWPMGAGFLLTWTGRHGARSLFRPAGLPLWLILIAPMLWWNVHLSASHRQGWWIPPLDVSNARQYAGEYLGLNVVEQWERSRLPRPVWTAFVLERLLMLGPGVLCASALLNRSTRRAAGAALAATAAYVGLLELSSLLAVRGVLVRTLLPGWAPMLLLMGLGAAGANGEHRPAVSLKSPRRCRAGLIRALCAGAPRAALGVVAGLCVVGWLWFAWAGPPRRPPCRAAFEWIRASLGRHDVVVFTTAGLEELTAYYLGDVVPVARMIGPNLPQVAGAPPVRRMIGNIDDPNSHARLRAALAGARRAGGGDYNVWCLEFGTIRGPEPGNFHEVLRERHALAAEFSGEDVRGVAAARYVPLRAAVTPSPATAAATAAENGRW